MRLGVAAMRQAFDRDSPMTGSKPDRGDTPETGVEPDTDPLSVDALEGEVVMTGPRVSVAMTPEAAAETAERLRLAAEAAQAQASQTSSSDA